MKIEGSHTIKAPRESLYQLMVDPEILWRCVPGCQSLEAVEDGSYRMVLKAGVGSIKGVFTGSIRLEEMREPKHYKMIVDAKGYILQVNEALKKMVSYTAEELIGKHTAELASKKEEHVKVSAEMITELYEKGFIESVEAVWIRKDGQYKELHTLKGHTKELSSAHFSSDGKYIVTTSKGSPGIVAEAKLNRKARIWEVASGKEIKSIDLEGQGWDAIFTPADKEIAIISNKKVAVGKQAGYLQIIKPEIVEEEPKPSKPEPDWEKSKVKLTGCEKE